MLRSRLAAVLAAAPLLAAAFTASEPPTAASPPPDAFTVSGVDLHDGHILENAGVYYLYGTMYGCGFRWQVRGGPWCGFGVATSTDLVRWSTPRRLFDPAGINPWNGRTWTWTCTSSGTGCFNPRMVIRTWGPADRVPILWFNAPDDYRRTRANGYYVMGCNGLTGPCGKDAGPPHGTTRKPPLYICKGYGDHSIVTDGPNLPSIMCTTHGQTIAQEQLDYWGTTGTGRGGTRLFGGATEAESPAAYKDPATGKWVATYNVVNCGYGSGCGTSYALADSQLGPWTVPRNTGKNVRPWGRNGLSATSCGGQPRTISILGGRAYQAIDLWGLWGGRYDNQTRAGLHYERIGYDPALGRGGPNDGTVWRPPFRQWTCA